MFLHSGVSYWFTIWRINAWEWLPILCLTFLDIHNFRQNLGHRAPYVLQDYLCLKMQEQISKTFKTILFV